MNDAVAPDDSATPDGSSACDTPAKPVDCDAPLVCPPADPGRMNICGRLVDTESGAVIGDSAASACTCAPLTPSVDGPCSVGIVAYEAFRSPMVPMADVESVVDSCGRVRVTNIPESFNGLIALATDDAGAQDVRISTEVVLAWESGTVANGAQLFSTSRETEAGWTTTAGMPFGAASFADVGTFLAVWSHEGEPTAGVQLLVNGVSVPAKDYYFGDVGRSRGTVQTSADVTGPNGAAIFADMVGVFQHKGTGAEPAGFCWPTGLFEVRPGWVMVAELEPEAKSGACP